METRVSILITFYNQEKYVDQALDSVFRQITNFGIKVLVGDDGSSDSTRDIVKKWIDKYPGQIELYVMNREKGKQIGGFRASKNRLNLLKHVTTDYFIYLDGDDYFTYDKKLQRQVEILDNPQNKDCIACGHNIDALFEDGSCKSFTSITLGEGKYTPREYWKELYFHTDTLLTRSTVISSIDFNLLENNFNDNMITFSIIQKGMLYYIPESWAVYLQTGDGIWTSGNTIVNYIRNMFLFDLCNKINPSMKRETRKRFTVTWFYLYKMRKSIDYIELQMFSVEAENKDLQETYNWIHYRELSFLQRQVLCIKTIYICWSKVVLSILKRMHNIFISNLKGKE